MTGLQDAVFNLLAVVLTGFVGMIATNVTKYFKKKGIVSTLQAKETSVMIAVDAIEQIARNEKVPDKFNAAKRLAIEFLNEQGISISETELDMLIESSVAEINKNIKNELE